MSLINTENNQNIAKSLVKDSDTANFASDAIKTSAQVPVIVDFWAPWSEPCKKLGPQLKRLTNQAGGLLRLVKINVDENPELASQLRIKSIPAICVFKNGQPIDGFIGEQSESKICAFFKRLTDGAKTPTELSLDKADDTLKAGDWKSAKILYLSILDEDANNSAATAGIIRCALAANDLIEARQIFDKLDKISISKPEITAALSALELIEQGNVSDDAAALTQKLTLDENNHQIRFDLVMALHGKGQSDEAINELLELT